MICVATLNHTAIGVFPSEARAEQGSSFSPSDLDVAIKKNGGVNNFVGSDEFSDKWLPVILAGIDSGNSSWLRPSIEINLVTDAGASETITAAIGRQVTSKPQIVFAELQRSFEKWGPTKAERLLRGVCSSVIPRSAKEDSLDNLLFELKKRRNSVEMVSEKKFNRLRNRGNSSVPKWYKK